VAGAVIDRELRRVCVMPPCVPAMQHRLVVVAAEFPVERIHGPVLLISGSDDQVWPAKILADTATARLHRKGHPFKVEHLCYEGAGHAIGPPHPYVVRTPTHAMHPTLGVDFELGGSPELNARASNQSWNRVVEFFRERFAIES